MSQLPPLPSELIPRDIQLQLNAANASQAAGQDKDLLYAKNADNKNFSNAFPTTATREDDTNLILSSERNAEIMNKAFHYRSNTALVQSEEKKRRLLSYPYDLATSQENMDFMLFDIYESLGAGVSTVEQKITADNAQSSEGVNVAKIGAATAVAVSTEGALAGAAGGLAVGGALTQGGAIIGGIASLSEGAKKASSDPNLGKGEIGFTQEMSGFAQATEKVGTSIALYAPATVEAKYGMEYESKDFTTLSAATAVGTGLIDWVKSLFSGESNEGSAAAMDAGMKLMGQQSLKMIDNIVMPIIGGQDGAGFGDLVSAQMRAVPNPLVLQLFKAVKRREFSFSYKFLPVSENEALTVYDIIRTFKKHSHPRRATQGRYLEFPSEFRIRYMHGSKENLYLPRIARCVLTGVDVKYGSDEVFSTFQPTVGREGTPPVQIEMTLSFSEVEILTRERIDQGF